MPSQGRRLFKATESGNGERRYLYDVDDDGEIIDSVGRELRQARVTLGYEIVEVSNSLRIRRAHLEALEEGHYDELPGSPYAVGFVRSYAKFLGLDAEAVVDRFKDEADNVDRRPKLDFPAPTDEGRRPKTWLIIASLVLAGIAYGGWQYFTAHRDEASRLGADVPDELASLATGAPEGSAPDLIAEPGPASAAPAGPAENAISSESSELAITAEALAPGSTGAGAGGAATPSTPSGPAAGEPVIPAGEEWVEGTDASATVAGPAAGEAGANASPAAQGVAGKLWESTVVAATTPGEAEPAVPVTAEALAPAYEPKVYGAENKDARIVIRSTGDSWVQVQGPENELLLTRILHAGDSFRVPDRSGIVMMTGNAGAIEIWLDNERLPSLGPVGLVRRDIVLEPEALHTLSATP